MAVFTVFPRARARSLHRNRVSPGTKSSAVLAVFCLWTQLLTGTAFACRYNVRDIGFIELDGRPYSMTCYVGDKTTGIDMASLAETASRVLRDCNIQFEVVNLDQQKDHPALHHLASRTTPSLPVAILVSPDDQLQPLTIPLAGRQVGEAISSALAEIASSPKREEIVTRVRQAYAAVLLVEGEDAAATARARKTIANAIAAIQSQMKWLPKTIEHPPELLVLDAASLAREKVLLWSLGLETAAESQPRALVIYGKARRIGSAMTGDGITEKKLTEILSIIGADCECGLDISWTQGTRLPVRWTDQLHAQVTKALGFDPENPLVKIEASNIMAKRGTGRVASIGYHEVSLNGASPISEEPVPEIGSTNHPAPVPPPAGRTPPPLLAQNQPVGRESLRWTGVLAAIIVLVGLLIVLRAAKRKQLE